MKVLIATAWSPTHSKWVAPYACGVEKQFSTTGAEVEVFITTTFAKTKFNSIVGSLIKAQQYALNNSFTHLFIVEADRKLGSNVLSNLLSVNTDVVIGIPNTLNFTSTDPFPYNGKTSGAGWGCTLVKINVLKRSPFEQALHGNGGMWPDRLWFKHCMFNNFVIKVLVVDEILLQPASSTIDSSFDPTLTEEKTNADPVNYCI